MKTVMQTDSNGCWIACVSMLTGEDYDQIKNRFSFRNEVTGRHYGPIIELLESLGYECDDKSTSISEAGSLADIDGDALVRFVNVDDEGDEGGGHWMVWDYKEKVIRDPEGWKADTCFKIKNFRRVRLKQ